MNPRTKSKRRRFSFNVGGYDWMLVTLVSLLCIFGLAFLASALSAKGADVYQREFFHQFVYGVWIGGFFAFVLSKIDYHILFKYKNLILLSTLALLGYLAFFIIIADLSGITKEQIVQNVQFLPIRPFVANGAMRWIATPLSNFQPSELIKFSLLVYFAAFLYDMEKNEEKFTWLRFKKPLYAFALSAFLIIIQPDLGSILLTFAILAAAMWVGKVPLKALVPVSTAVVIFALFMSLFVGGYRRDRIEAIFNPESEKAYQINQVQNAIRNGGMWGQGYGNSEYKQNNLIPESTTDAILGIIGEEMGFVFTTAFLSLYLWLFLRGIWIANRAPDVGGKALAVGISVWIVTQAFLNITGITGITPLKGLPLPFVSEGGSSLVINLATIGILLNISKQIETKKQHMFQHSSVQRKPFVFHKPLNISKKISQ
jgi:cell division protein FtsW